MAGAEHLNGQLFEGSIKGGTPQLFSTKEMLTDRARYPRGYTPGRMREVRSSGLSVYGHRPVESVDEDARRDRRIAMGQRNVSERQVRENIARSTIDITGQGTLFKRTQIQVVDKASLGTNHVTGGDVGGTHSAGPYQYVGSDGETKVEEGGDRHFIKVAHGLEQYPTVIHELGHAVSYNAGRAHSSYHTDVHQGAEEAFADDFAARNWRDRRGQAHPDPQGYGRHGRGGMKSPAFADAYFGHRETMPDLRAQRIAKTERLLSGIDHPLIPPGHVPGQIPLLEGDMTGSHASGDERVKWDYTREQKDVGITRDNPEESYLSPRAAKVRAARLPQGTKVNTKVEWGSGAIRR